MVDFQLMQRGNHSSRDGGRVHAVVIHYTGRMARPPSNTANNVVAWGKKQSCNVSWHACVDENDIIWCIDETRAAWHALGYNRHTVGVEIGGGLTSFKPQDNDTWRNWYEETMNNAAAVTAYWCTRFDIPVVDTNERVRQAGSRGERIQEGIFGHDATTPWRTWKGEDGNRKSLGAKIDPGKYFNWNDFMNRVRKFYPMTNRPFHGQYQPNLQHQATESLTNEEIAWLRANFNMT